MGTEQVVTLFRHTMQMALLMGAPLLLIAVLVSLLVNVAQVLTSLQDQTLSTVPRLAAMAAAILLLFPWMLRKLMFFTIGLWSDFHPFVR
ncbi:MAG TPA: flagellar biosynthetic protein FliQ [Terriglobales bacterium]|jgi:flagellar biosynthesis protein FliQ|nr:flagellar biosynthetic protein FliQ [Terriglobales bacterium]